MRFNTFKQGKRTNWVTLHPAELKQKRTTRNKNESPEEDAAAFYVFSPSADHLTDLFHH